MELFIKAGGVYLFICAISHLVFPQLYHWQDKLDRLEKEDTALILNTLKLMNYCQFILWLIFAVIAFFFSQELLNSQLGKCILSMIVIFWVIRIFLLQPIYVGFKTKISKLQVVFFLIGLILFLIPWFNVVVAQNQ
jgi:hypothetical protein